MEGSKEGHRASRAKYAGGLRLWDRLLASCVAMSALVVVIVMACSLK